jgi:signal transduction histidine kinase
MLNQDSELIQSLVFDFFSDYLRDASDTILLLDRDLKVIRIIACATETCITPEALNKGIDEIPGFCYPDYAKKKILEASRKAFDTQEIVDIDLSFPGHLSPVDYFDLRFVPMRGRFVVMHIKNVTKIKQKEQENQLLSKQLNQSRKMVELALHNSNVVLYSFDFRKCASCNKINCNHCFQFYGKINQLLERNQHICLALAKVSHPEDSQDFFLLFNTIRTKGLDECTMNFRLKTDEGDYHSYEVLGKTLERDADGKPVLIVGSIIDSQKHVEYEQSLINAKEKAETADKMKSAFLANMTHEIRTPLNAIVGFSDLLSDETDPRMRDTYINLIKTNNELLLNLINDVLDISKIEVHMMKFFYDTTPLLPLMNEVCSTVKIRVSEDVSLINDGGEDISINVDRTRLSQILINLLTNAAKNTSEGFIHMGFTKEGEMIRFYVSDTGCGIPPAELEHIFARFVQLDGRKQGVGLGLAICKGLVSQMGGHISATSEVGKGSTFSFTLPIEGKPADEVKTDPISQLS